MAALNGKSLCVSDVSLHLMNDWMLSVDEYLEPGQFNTKLCSLNFPYEYPVVNHPSTLVLIKGPFVTPSIKIDFNFENTNKLAVKANIEYIESKVNVD